MQATATVDRVRFNGMIEHLKRVTGMSFKDIIRAQAKMILNYALKHTPKATIAKVVARYYPFNLNYRGGVGELEFTTLKESGVTYPLALAEGHHWYYPNRIWRKIIKQSKESITKRAQKEAYRRHSFI